MRARRSVLALLTALALVATACGGKGDKKATGGSTKATSPSVEASDINKTARDQLPDGGTLKWVIDNIPPNFNYNELDGTSADNAAVIGGLLPGMFKLDGLGPPSGNKDHPHPPQLTAKGPQHGVTPMSNPQANRRHRQPRPQAPLTAHREG